MAALPPLTDLRLDELPTGEPPRVAYVRQNVVVSPNGRRTILERPPVAVRPELEDTTGLNYLTVLRVPTGWVGVTHDAMQPVTTLHSGDGTFERYLRMGFDTRADVSRRGRWVLLDAANGVRLLDGHMTGPVVTLLRRLPSHAAVLRTSAGFVAAETVAVNVQEVGSGQAARVLLVSRTSPTTTIPGLRRVAATSETSHRVSGTTSSEWNARADTVFSIDGTPILHTPGLELISFSPDGSFVVGTPNRFNGRRVVLIEVATGRVLAYVRVLPYDVAWEDGRHLLAVAGRRGRAFLGFYAVRISVSGEVELALHTRLPGNGRSHLALAGNRD